jgi:hypothetical protein
MLQYDVFIDESGIFRKFGHSIYCLTICDSKLSLNVDNFILDIEKELKISPFHWRDHNWKIKTKFLKELLKIEDWKCILIVIDNKRYSDQILYELLSSSLKGFTIKRMYIDGKKHKRYIDNVKKTLKKVGVNISELKMVRHQAKGGLRISDAVAGLARLHYDRKTKDNSLIFYRKFLKQKIAQVVSDIL